MIFNEMMKEGSVRKPYKKIDKWIKSFPDNSYEKNIKKPKEFLRELVLHFLFMKKNLQKKE